MPDPRSFHPGAEIIIGYDDERRAMDTFGRRPGDTHSVMKREALRVRRTGAGAVSSTGFGKQRARPRGRTGTSNCRLGHVSSVRIDRATAREVLVRTLVLDQREAVRLSICAEYSLQQPPDTARTSCSRRERTIYHEGPHGGVRCCR